MPTLLEDLIASLEKSRSHLLKHFKDVHENQWDWKPYPECKTLRETLQHLIIDDQAALESLRSGEEPSYDQSPMNIHELHGPDGLFENLKRSHEALISELRKRFADASLDTEVCVWGSMERLVPGIAYFASEDFFHAGQVSFIRMASDPEWDYYDQIYGEHYDGG